MYSLTSLDNDEFKLLIQDSAESLHINEAIVEKDFWVCLLLDYLFTKSKYKDLFILKGGTSLSKGYSYINRFSEDIDLVIKYTFFDSRMDEILSPTSSNNHRVRLCERLDSLTADFVQNELLIDIKENFGKLVHRNIDVKVDSKDPMTLNLYYPILFGDNYLLPFIKIECGSLSSLGPTEIVYISSLVYNSNPLAYPEEAPFKVELYSPIKTYWEKINAIHTCFVKPLSKATEDRFSRHLYDVYSLSKTDIKDKALKDLDLQLETVNTSDAFYHYGWLDIERMRNHDYTLVPRPDQYEKIRSDYEGMKRMIWGDKPSFEELIDYLKKLQDEIKNL